MKIYIISFSLIMCLFVFCAFSTVYEDDVISWPAAGEYKVFANGIVKIEREPFDVYVRSFNTYVTASGVSLFFYPWMDKHEKNNYRFVGPSYYVEEDNNLNDRRPEVFFVELMLRAKQDIAIDPMNAKVSTKDVVNISPIDYRYVVGRLHKPLPHSGGGFGVVGLVPYDDSWTKTAYANHREIQLSKNQQLGIALKFDAPVPIPGEPFSIKINGLTVNGQPVDLPEIRYGEAKKYRWSHN